MSIADNQQRTLLSLLAQLRPHWRRDRNFPGRVQTLLSRNRSFGSRDRRLYRELIYTAVRFLPWIEPLLEVRPDRAVALIAWLAADAPATANFRQSFLADWPPCPTSVSEKAVVLGQAGVLRDLTGPDMKLLDPDDLLPAWFRTESPEAFAPAQLDVLHMRAPLWLRARPESVGRITAEFNQLGWHWELDKSLPTAIRVIEDVDVTKSSAFPNGLFEVQDLASQFVLESAGIAPGTRWLDACAGAGGKTLQLAQLLGPSGRVDAFDVRRSALLELSGRAARAHATTISVLEHTPTEQYDGVLVDAPCTGSGTWRRAPHLKWTTTPEQVADAVAVQRTLLADFAQRVRVDGRLLYATCSLNRSENEAVVADFLVAHPAYVSEPPQRDFGGIVRGGGLTLLPALHNNDGFFVAAFRRHL